MKYGRHFFSSIQQTLYNGSISAAGPILNLRVDVTGQSPCSKSDQQAEPKTRHVEDPECIHGRT